MKSKTVKTVVDALEKLTKTQKNGRVLTLLRDQERHGWEKWLQVELAALLSNLGTPEFEVKHPYNGLFKRPKFQTRFQNSFIDLLFREDNHIKNIHTAIEIKMIKRTKV